MFKRIEILIFSMSKCTFTTNLVKVTSESDVDVLTGPTKPKRNLFLSNLISLFPLPYMLEKNLNNSGIVRVLKYVRMYEEKIVSATTDHDLLKFCISYYSYYGYLATVAIKFSNTIRLLLLLIIRRSSKICMSVADISFINMH